MPIDSRPAHQWFTLVRFKGDPEHLTAVSQATTAVRALALLAEWTQRFPAEACVVFNPANHPVTRPLLERLAQASDGRHVG